jgi:hypothetical protein
LVLDKAMFADMLEIAKSLNFIMEAPDKPTNSAGPSNPDD